MATEKPGTCLVSSRNSKKANATSWERKIQSEIREVRVGVQTMQGLDGGCKDLGFHPR